MNQAGLDGRLQRASVGDIWRLHAFRRDELHQFEVVLQAAEANTFVLAINAADVAERSWPVA